MVRRRLKASRTTKGSFTVFISHSSRDAWVAKRISESVQRKGAETWLDEKDLEGGSIVVADIINAIDKCDEAIVLVSPNCITSQWVMFEIGAVRGQHKRVTPILDNVSYTALNPVRDVKSVDINKFDKFLTELERRIRVRKSGRR